MGKKLTNEDKKALAQQLFLDTDKTQKEIATIAQITEKTLTKWKKEGDWELLRQAQTVTSANLISNLYQKAYDLSLEDKIDADKLVKLANTIEKLSNKKVTVSNMINVFKDFTSWAFGVNPELAKEINLLQRKYVDHKING